MRSFAESRAFWIDTTNKGVNGEDDVCVVLFFIGLACYGVGCKWPARGCCASVQVCVHPKPSNNERDACGVGVGRVVVGGGIFVGASSLI